MYKRKDEVGTFHGCLGLPQEFETVSHRKRIEERIAVIHCLDFLFSHKTQIQQYRLDDEVYELRDQEQ